LLLLAVNRGLVRPCLSAAILKEYSEVLARPKFSFSPAEIAAAVDLLRLKGDLVHPPPENRVSPDPEDDKFIACALGAQVDFIVTGNKKDFPAGKLEAARVVGAGELLKLITLEL
jgi:putative PIN family toxin of toxin-antitoxin system